MVTIQQLREMNKREFAKFIRKLNKTAIVNLLEYNKIYAKTNLKSDELIDILLDVVEGERTPKEEDVKRIARRKRIRETREENKKRLLEQQRIEKEKMTKEEKRLEEIYNQLSNYEKALIIWNYGFENGMAHIGVIFDLIEQDLVPSFIKKDMQLISFMENIELNGYKNLKRLLFHVHPDTCKNFKTYEYTDLSKNFEEFKSNIFGIEN